MAPFGVFVVLETLQTRLSRGRRSRNKVSVGEPAEGSFQQQMNTQKLFNPRAYSSLALAAPGGWDLFSKGPASSFFSPTTFYTLTSD